jgi:uncharacterized protein (DUF2141 family)
MKTFILSLLLVSIMSYSQTLTINITGIRSSSGSMVMAFYNTQESFDKEKPLYIKKATKTAMKNGTLSITYEGMKSGIYGIAILDDENNNDKMDYGLFLPKEGFGFSGYYHTGLSKPPFSKFSFTIKNDNKAIEIKVRYL